ncbi:T9SS type A sorting domain-containing protein [Chryseobacterium gallinarum]|uniref:T9SS type A sorting domain-containing protein n=1 Tax=Chryseobacterium gallinarum TaxID=1324352 RepID=UPI002024BF26|nr:T9SS type A sorting domain-containing protein [Chryseobacterium gallinarum]MCL8536513.1 T9SS type A sorting domain-containing protein [Chryseobacterium gallinarum]
MKNYLLPGKDLLCKVMTAAFLFLTTALYYGQLEKTYISSQTNQIFGVCVLCGVNNPQNVVGSNENDYATLKIPIGVSGRIEQNFIFPKLSPGFRKIVMGIETPNVSIKEQAKREIYIETFNGNVSNGDRQRLNVSMLKPGPNLQKGTIEFTSSKRFDKVHISVYSGLIGLGEELRIYYVYHLPAPFTTCGNPPLDPQHYYPFDGNEKDLISDHDFFSKSEIDSHQNLVCGEAIYGGVNVGQLHSDYLPYKSAKTIAFWVSMDNAPMATDGIPEFLVKHNEIDINGKKWETGSYVIDVHGYNELGPVRQPVETTSITPDELTHITLVYNEDQYGNRTVCLYKNGVPANNIVPCKAFKYEYQQSDVTILDINLQQSKMDELIIYDRALTSDEVKTLSCSYGILPNCNSGNTSTVAKIASAEEVFTVSPNPTTGQITLDGNILFLDADISITNTSGKEVYRSKFISKTFELPSTLPGGVYILNLQTKDKKMHSRKIILNR